jgi:hypothetical protein
LQITVLAPKDLYRSFFSSEQVDLEHYLTVMLIHSKLTLRSLEIQNLVQNYARPKIVQSFSI